MKLCFGEKKSGFPVQPGEKIRKNRVFWSTYRESCYHTFDNSVVRHIPHFFSHMFSKQPIYQFSKTQQGQLEIHHGTQNSCQCGKVFTKKRTKLPWKKSTPVTSHLYFKVWLPKLRTRSFEASQENPHRWETIQLLKVWDIHHIKCFPDPW